MAWAQTAIYTVCICYLLKREYKYANCQFRTALGKCAGSSGKNSASKSPKSPHRSPGKLCMNALKDNPETSDGAGGSTSGSPTEPNPIGKLPLIKGRHLGINPDTYRRKHLELALVCAQLDRTLSKFLSAVFLIDVPIVSISMFSFFFTNPAEDELTLFGGIVCYVHVVIHLVAITLAATSMSSAVSIFSTITSTTLNSKKKIVFFCLLRYFTVK